MTRAAMLIYESRGSGLRLSDALRELLETRVLPHATQSNAEEWRKELGSLEVRCPEGSLCMQSVCIGACTGAHSHKLMQIRGVLSKHRTALQRVFTYYCTKYPVRCAPCAPPLVVARFSTEHCCTCSAAHADEQQRDEAGCHWLDDGNDLQGLHSNAQGCTLAVWQHYPAERQECVCSVTNGECSCALMRPSPLVLAKRRAVLRCDCGE